MISFIYVLYFLSSIRLKWILTTSLVARDVKVCSRGLRSACGQRKRVCQTWSICLAIFLLSSFPCVLIQPLPYSLPHLCLPIPTSMLEGKVFCLPARQTGQAALLAGASIHSAPESLASCVTSDPLHLLVWKFLLPCELWTGAQHCTGFCVAP